MSGEIGDDDAEEQTRRLNSPNWRSSLADDTQRLEPTQYETDQSLPTEDVRVPGQAYANSSVCVECGGMMKWSKVLSSKAYYIFIATFDQPDSFSEMVALACTNCGFTKMFTLHPGKLLGDR